MDNSGSSIVPHRRGLQFSLRTLFLLMVLLSAAGSLWLSLRQMHENQRLRTENTALRNEFGALTIEPGTEDKLHIIAIPSPTIGRLAWKWRIYVPPGKTYLYSCHFGAQRGPVDPGPAGGGVLPSSGESLLTVELTHEGSGNWQWQIEGAFGKMAGKAWNQDAKDFVCQANQAAKGQTLILEPGKWVELLRVDGSPVMPGQTKADTNDKLRDGIVFWILPK